MREIELKTRENESNWVIKFHSGLQSTDFFDKTRNKIFDEDILKVIYPVYCKPEDETDGERIAIVRVFWNQAEGSWFINYINNNEALDEPLADIMTLEVHIIGNTYQNPELLK